MISVSSAYKRAMSKKIRDRAYISVGIGIINQEAQESGRINENLAYWSNGNVFDTNQSNIEYATLEENYFRADGTMYVMPEINDTVPFLTNGIATNNVLGLFRVDFPKIFSIKGITLEFGSAYPTEFEVKTAEKTLNYTNDGEKFMSDDVLGDTDYIIIKPISMVGGQQRFRLQSILMGVGLQYSNNQTKDLTMTEFVSSISSELPSNDFQFTFYDEQNRFNVDDDNSFIDFLETMQKITISFGITLEDSSVEWMQFGTMYLKDWKSQKGIVSLTATDRLSQMEDDYSLSNRIYDRTAYQEAKSIFEDAGLEPDEYYIDEYLHDVQIHNPMPEGKHKECLQLLANACRCILRQDANGRIMIRANFGNTLSPEEMDVITNGVTDWSKPRNILTGSNVVYADMTSNFITSDGKMYFLPEDGNYLETSYVSEQISNESGDFDINPTLTIQMPAAYTYFSVNVDFDGNAPKEMIIHTYKEDVLLGSVRFSDLENENSLFHEFTNFDKMTFEFSKGYSNNRVLVNRVTFGDYSDYVLTKTDMMSQLVGYKERRVKAVRCKIFTYTTDEEGNPQEIEDAVFATKVLNEVGDTKTVQNPLVSEREHAELLAEWIGNYFANNISYEVDYRGEPRNNASDIIHMESDVLDRVQVEIEKHTLKYNGAFSGSMDLRRALKMTRG